MMIMSLFLGLLLIGALYYILGIGDALLYRRVMQDGADAGAFAASVIAAKGMNLHVLLNVVMAVTAGVLLVIRSVEVLLEIILAILSGLAASIVLAPKALPLIAAITPAEAEVEKIGDAVEQFVRIAHDALDVAHHAVQHGYPLLADARAVDVMAFQGAYTPPVSAGFVIPLLGPRLPEGGHGLPVENGDVGILCDRAANALGNRLGNVRSKVPKWLLKFLGGVVAKALRLGKRRTCSEDVVESPRGVIGARSDGTTVWLGHEEFQYRGYTIGRAPQSGHWQTGERGVRIAQAGGTQGRNWAYKLHAVGRVGLAQSEYYFDGGEDKSEWLWKQRWRARLRRFRISRSWLPSGILSACSAAGGRTSHRGLSAACDVIRDFSINAVSAH
ncbi:MAG: hypothetical protein AMJ63_00230 [Myxococcales bacterium SG8_38_1]|nr:MAG: hypothetical protein AMJ63_00230 [Myxococcales bacterium SG8_38_1]